MISFQLFDDDHSGKITLKNMKRVARELGENLSEEELDTVGKRLQRRKSMEAARMTEMGR